MGKRDTTLGQRIWHQVRHPFAAVVNRRNEPATTRPVSGRDESLQFSVLCHPSPKPLPFLHAASVLLVPSLPASVVAGQPGSEDQDPSVLLAYLLGRENTTCDINKLNDLLQMPQVLLEIGCGNAEAARQIALKNPGIGVIATDLYDWSRDPSQGSSYGKIARAWRGRQLPAQLDTPANLVILRAEADLLRCLPLLSIDTILLLNPEPRVGRSFLALFREELLSSRVKRGLMQIVILPFSRELGLGACGGFSFDHDPDWSRGLGFIMGSGLRFQLGTSVQWGVDLSQLSAYTGNSTQRGIYVFGEPPG